MSEEIKEEKKTPLTEISSEEKYAIQRRSAYILPDNPSERGWTAENIKKAFYELICAEDNSVLALLARIIGEGNVAFEVHENTRQELLEAKENGEFDGVSVLSVEQTASSDESGGENKIKVTLSNGEESVFTVKNGKQGEQGIQGKQGEQGIQGKQGEQGERGAPFKIVKVYSSKEEMEADFENDDIPPLSLVLIETGDVEDIDNSSLYIKGESAYKFVTDMSGAQGIQGPAGKNAYVRYSSSEDGSGMTETWSEGQNYIGFATAQSAPTNAAEYTWVCIAPDFPIYYGSKLPKGANSKAVLIGEVPADISGLAGSIKNALFAFYRDGLDVFRVFSNGTVFFRNNTQFHVGMETPKIRLVDDKYDESIAPSDWVDVKNGIASLESLNTKMDEVVKTNASQHAGIMGNKKRINLLEATAEGKLFAVDENFPTYVEGDYEPELMGREYYPQALVSKISINNTDGKEPRHVVTWYDDTGYTLVAYAEIPETIRAHAAFCKPYISHGITFESGTVVDFENGYISRVVENASLPSDFKFVWTGDSTYECYFYYDDLIITNFTSGLYGGDEGVYIDYIGGIFYCTKYGGYGSDDYENVIKNIVSNASIPATIEVRVPIIADMLIEIQEQPPVYNMGVTITTSVADDTFINDPVYFNAECLLDNSSATIKAYAKI